jgi:ATP/maltotriose-dependent transcriptional regulator MalT
MRAVPGAAASDGPDAALFVGRREELGVLADAFADARAGRPRIVLVEGAAGIGKTALVARALRDAGLGVVRASGDEGEAGVPFAMLDQLLRQVPPGSDHHPTLPALRPSDLPDAMAGGARLVDVLGLIQERGPAALVVDDLHWCDAPSLQALLFALRRLRADHLVAVLVVRSEASARLPRGFHELVASEAGRHLSVTGLHRDDLRKLAAALGVRSLPRRALARLTAHTRGSPLHARALLLELEPDELVACGEAPLPAPRPYASLVLERLSGGSSGTARLVEAAAVLGNRCSRTQAMRLAGPDVALTEVEEAVKRNLLRVVDSGPGRDLVFTHPLVRASIYHDLGVSKRAELHARAASLSDHERARLGHRVAACSGRDQGLATELVMLATRELGAGLTGATAAADALQAAASVATTRSERQSCYLRALECLIAAGDLGTATHLSGAMSDFSDTPALRYLQGALALHEGRMGEAEGLLGSAWEMSGPDDPGLAAGIAAQLAIIHLRRAEAEEVVRWARRSLDAGGPRIPVVFSPTTALALGLVTAGRYQEAATVLADPPDLSGDQDPIGQETLFARGIVQLWSDDPTAARSDLLAALDAARRRGLLLPAAFALYHLAEAEFRLGAWDESVVHSQLAVSMAEDADQFGMLASVHGNAALPLACRGDWDAAGAHVDAALRATAALPDPTNVTWAHSARAVLAAARGEHRVVVESAKVIAEALRGGGDEPAIKPWRILGAEALVALSEPDQADRLLRPYEERAEAGGLSLARASARRARGLIELARGDWREAERHFELALIGTSAAPFERAQTELAYGSLLRRRGRRRHADALLRAAEATFGALGAAPYAQRTHRELLGCGLSPVRRSPEMRYRLTPQEQTVAHLVVKGLRNREVAAELVVSIKTVEYHLGNIYRKLQVSSRTQLVARLAAADGADDDDVDRTRPGGIARPR